MKKSAIIIATFLFLAAFIGFSLFYAKIYKPAHSTEPSSSVYYVEGMNKKHAGKKVLLAELAEEDFHLYQDGDYIILVHDGKEVEFDDWSSKIAEETPEMYYFDINGDNENELIIRALEGIDEQTGEKYYCVYALSPITDEAGNLEYEISFANRATWYSTFSDIIVCEVSQPKINKKRVQLVMEQAKKTINYDSETGIVKGSRGWFIKALSDNKNNYYTFKDWYLGPGTIIVDEQDKCLRVQVNFYIKYNEIEEAQIGGIVKCGIELKGKDFQIMNKSVTFNVDSKYKTSSLIRLAEEDWQYIFHNTENYSSSDKIINNASFRCSLSEKSMEEYSIFSGSTEETKAIDKIVLTKNTMKLYAKNGYAFSPDIVNGFKHRVTVNLDGIETDIILSASINDENGTSVLTFVLDKDYPVKELKNFNVKLGG